MDTNASNNSQGTVPQATNPQGTVPVPQGFIGPNSNAPNLNGLNLGNKKNWNSVSFMFNFFNVFLIYLN